MTTAKDIINLAIVAINAGEHKGYNKSIKVIEEMINTHGLTRETNDVLQVVIQRIKELYQNTL